MKTSIRIGAVLGGTGGMLYLFLSHRLKLIPVIICLARVGQSIIFNTAIISVNRLFPTTLVATAYGVVNFFGHLVACLSPFVAEIKNPYPFIVFEILIGVAIFSSFYITELSTAQKEGSISPQETTADSTKEKEDAVATDF
jgi:hypothetical protein